MALRFTCRLVAPAILARRMTSWSPRVRPYRTSCAIRSKSEDAALSGKIEVHGGELYYERRGTGPHALVCIPGALGTVRTDFAPQLDYFGQEDSGYTVVAFDPRGYGSSRPPQRKFSTEYEHFYREDANDAFGLMKALGFLKFSVLGWSDGGVSGVILAARFPEAVSKLVIWGANAYVSEEDIQLFESIRDVSNWSAKMRDPFEAIYGSATFPKLWSEWVDALITLRKARENSSVCMEEVQEVKCPTFILHGKKDPMCPFFHADFFHENLKQSKLHIFPEGKHNIHLRYAQEFNEVVDKFLRE